MAESILLQRAIKTADLIAKPALQLAALGLLAMLLVKAIFDVDNHFDSWWYHLPWAARLAGLIGPDTFLFEPIAAVRFEGFPVLPELLQGLFWRVTGRVESANLVSFASLVAFILFLRHYFRVPWWLTVPALLAVPLIQGQATSTYVDLIANFAMAAFVLLTFLAYTRNEAINYGFLAAMALSAFVAANSKLQLIPIIALTLIFAAYPVGKWIKSRTSEPNRTARLTISALALLIAISAIFMVPLKNLVKHGNPIYPLKVEILGTTLNHAELLPPAVLGGGAMAEMPQIEKWVYSVLEIGMGPVFNVRRWSIDSAAPVGAPLGIQGGLFGIYVVLHFFLLLGLLSRTDANQRRSAAVLVVITITAAAFMPASHLLRYYMFWFICVISLNLYFLTSFGSHRVQWVPGAVLFSFVLVVVDATDQNFIRPRFQSVQALLAERVDARVLRELTPYADICLVLDHANEPFLYAPIWYPGAKYSIKAGPFYPKQEAAEIGQVCEGRKIILSSASKE